jgi:hypothetical protein
MLRSLPAIETPRRQASKGVLHSALVPNIGSTAHHPPTDLLNQSDGVLNQSDGV